MTDSIFETFRTKLPLDAQIGYGWLKYKIMPRPLWEDKQFIRYYEWLEKTQWWSKDDLKNFQLDNLKALVKHAYENVPYYRRIFDEHKLKPDDIVTLNDIQKIPLLYKEVVRNNLEDFIARNYDRSALRYITTNGTSGRPLGVYQNKNTVDINEMAFVYRQWSWVGYQFGDRFITLRGNIMPERGAWGKKTWWEYNPGHHELRFSSLNMTDENLFQYIEMMKKYQPKFIQAYPSSLEILLRFMKRYEIKIDFVKAIFCESETIYPPQRRNAEAQFGCNIYGGYGMTERAADAVECERHQGYHVNMEYGILELLDENDEPIDRPGVPGRVVGTGFDTYCMPFIRYVTDDIAEYAPNECACKRQSTLIRDFKGRLTELVFSKSGNVIPLSAVFINIHGEITTKIREVKILQERMGELVIYIAIAPGFSEAEVKKELLDEIYKRTTRNEIDAEIIFVDQVSRSGRGKIGFLEQKLPIKAEYLNYIENEM